MVPYNSVKRRGWEGGSFVTADKQILKIRPLLKCGKSDQNINQAHLQKLDERQHEGDLNSVPVRETEKARRLAKLETSKRKWNHMR